MSEHSQASSAFNALTAPLNLLIVENVSEDAELIALALEEAAIDFAYRIADTLSDCRHLLTTAKWDAVLSDFRLLGFTAYQVLELMQELDVDVPLILITGTLGEESAVDCLKAGMTDYVLKDRLFRLPMVLARSLHEFELRRQKQAAMIRIQQQATREIIINRIVQAMRGTLVMEDVLQTTVERLHDALAINRCLIFLPKAGQHMTCQYTSQRTWDKEQLWGVRCGLFEYYYAQLRQGVQICLSRSDATLSPVVKEIMSEYGIQSVVLTPLVHQQDYSGGLCLQQCDYERVWTEDERAMVRAIADQCAIALHQTQLFQQVQQQAQREQLLNQIGRALNSSLDPDYILQEIVKVTGECFSVDRVMLFSTQDGHVHITHEWLAHEDLASMLNFTTSIAEWLGLIDPTTGAFFTQPYHLPDSSAIALTPRQQQCFEFKKSHSLLSVPIYIHGQFAGGLEIHTEAHQRHFSPDEILFLQRIADQAAIALYNARSYERLEEQVHERTKELEMEKLRSDAANRAKSEFLANMSHELRTPLTSILGFSSVLLKQAFGTLNSKQEQYLNNIYASGEHLLDLINDLLDLSKIEAGREELTLEAIDVQEICEASLEYIREQAEKKGLAISLAIAQDNLTCTADHRRLKQILVNLLSNAAKFTEKGSVLLSVTKQQNQLLFNVKDTGIGIAQPDLEHLFQPFHQLQSGLDRKYQGTGLGLALARKLAQLHGGTITVLSTLGEGSCFTLHLPTRPIPEG